MKLGRGAPSRHQQVIYLKRYQGTVRNFTVVAAADPGFVPADFDKGVDIVRALGGTADSARFGLVEVHVADEPQPGTGGMMGVKVFREADNSILELGAAGQVLILEHIFAHDAAGLAHPVQTGYSGQPGPFEPGNIFLEKLLQPDDLTVLLNDLSGQIFNVGIAGEETVGTHHHDIRVISRRVGHGIDQGGGKYREG